jgi:hypothetical protein
LIAPWNFNNEFKPASWLEFRREDNRAVIGFQKGFPLLGRLALPLFVLATGAAMSWQASRMGEGLETFPPIGVLVLATSAVTAAALSAFAEWTHRGLKRTRPLLVVARDGTILECSSNASVNGIVIGVTFVLEKTWRAVGDERMRIGIIELQIQNAGATSEVQVGAFMVNRNPEVLRDVLQKFCVDSGIAYSERTA